MVADLEPVNVSALLGKKASTVSAANMLRKQLLRLLDYAITLRIRTDNPVRVTKPYRIKTNGFHTWTEEEIAAFEARHPLGTKARLALALMLWTGQRRSDAIRMGRQHVAKGRLRVRQQKTDTALSLPILPPLAAAIAAMPSDNMTFLVTAYGKPFTPAGFGNWFRDRCDEAGLPPVLRPRAA
jgi:integrase